MNKRNKRLGTVLTLLFISALALLPQLVEP